MPRLSDLNRSKRDAAYSGRSNIGDVPWLYALQDQQAAANQPAGIGQGGGMQGDEAAPNPMAAGVGGVGSGGAGGAADTGMPGPGQTGLGGEGDQLFRAIMQQREGGQAGEPGGVGDNYSESPYADPMGFGTVGSIGGQLTGIPGLGLLGAGVGAAYDYELAKQFDPSYDFSLGSFLGSFGNIATGGIFGDGSQLGDAIGDYQGATGTGLNEAALAAGVTGGAYSGPKGVSGPSAYGGGGGAAESSFGAEALASPATPGAHMARDVVDRARRDRGGGAGEGGGGGGGGFGCFVGDTHILMADGSRKKIRLIEKGDMVMSFDGLGPLEPREVVAAMKYKNQKPIRVYFGDGKGIVVTPEHPFLTDSGEYRKAGDLKPRDLLVSAEGFLVSVLSINRDAKRAMVYNFEVEGLHTYVAKGLRVHNIKHAGGVISEDRVPGQLRGDVPETLQEGEGVLTADAVGILGPGFIHGVNMMARMMRR